MPQPKENSPIKRDILFRVHLLYAAFVLIAALVFARLIWVQLFSSEVAYNALPLSGRNGLRQPGVRLAPHVP